MTLFRFLMFGIFILATSYLLLFSGYIWEEVRRQLALRDPLAVGAFILAFSSFVALALGALLLVLTARRIRFDAYGFVPAFRQFASRDVSESGRIPWNRVVWIEEVRSGSNSIFLLNGASGKLYSIPEIAFQNEDRNPLRDLIAKVMERRSGDPDWGKPKRTGLFSK